MQDLNKSDAEARGYSSFAELPYVLKKDVQLPILSFLTDDLRVRYMEVLKLFSEFCKKKKYNPNCTTTWPYFVIYIRAECSNLIQRKFYNLNVLLLRAINAASKKCAEKEPQVQFEPVTAEVVKIETRGTDTREAREARFEQGRLKDVLVDRVIADPRPILDLGGGDNAMERSLANKGVDKEVVVKDVLLSPSSDFSKIELTKYPGHQLVANHSTYHMPMSFLLSFIKRRPRGIVMVLDSEEDEIVVTGEDYDFHAVRDKRYDKIFAYKVSGNIFAVKSSGNKGRSFADELWFTRKQWSDWGFSLYSDPSQKNSFVKRHVVLFDGTWKPSPSRPATEPEAINLTEGEIIEGVTRRVQPLYEMFRKDRDSDLNCLLGQWHYQTPKIDGIAMKMIVRPDRRVTLVDKMGLCYDLGYGTRRTVLLKEYPLMTFSVELLPLIGTQSSFMIYANQVENPVRRLNENDALSELVYNVSLFNRLAGFPLLGLKDYYLSRNSVVRLGTKIPHDGVVYLMAYALACQKRTQVHCFHKPFSGTDTIPHVLSSEQLRSRMSRSEFSIFYRTQAIDSTECSTTVPLTRENVFSRQIQTIMNSSVIDSSDFFGPTTVSPLMYEGYYIPAHICGTEKDAFIITHVRGDKLRKDVEVDRFCNADWVAKGIIGLTRWGNDARDVLESFFLNLSPTRVLKLLPSNVGVQANFLVNFFQDWNNRRENDFFKSLNEHVVGNIYSSSVDVLLTSLRKILPYGTTLFFLDTLFRYSFVARSFTMAGKTIKTHVSFDIGAKFEALALSSTCDAYGAELFNSRNVKSVDVKSVKCMSMTGSDITVSARKTK